MVQNSNEERNVNRVSMRFSYGNGKMVPTTIKTLATWNFGERLICDNKCKLFNYISLSLPLARKHFGKDFRNCWKWHCVCLFLSQWLFLSLSFNQHNLAKSVSIIKIANLFDWWKHTATNRITFPPEYGRLWAIQEPNRDISSSASFPFPHFRHTFFDISISICWRCSNKHDCQTISLGFAVCKL